MKTQAHHYTRVDTATAATPAPAAAPGTLLHVDGPHRRVLRGCGRHHFTEPAGTGTRAEGALAHLGGHQVIGEVKPADMLGLVEELQQKHTVRNMKQNLQFALLYNALRLR